MHTILILGVGNTLRTDDGLGVAVVEHLQRHYRFPGHVELICGGTQGITLRHLLADRDWLILVDAVLCDQPPASRVECHDKSLSPMLSRGYSSHHAGLAEVLDLLRFTGQSPRKISLFGLVPVCVEPGLGLSPAVTGQLPTLVGRILACLRQAGILVKSINP